MDGRRARALLGVGIDAGPDEIRRAFRVQALVTHPDHGGDRVAFELVVLAFETLQHVDVVARRCRASGAGPARRPPAVRRLRLAPPPPAAARCFADVLPRRDRAACPSSTAGNVRRVELWELAAREAIRETIASYTYCADSGRFDDFAALFAADGVLEVHGEAPLAGRDAIRGVLRRGRRAI